MSYYGDGKRRRYHDSVQARIFLWEGENIVCSCLRGPRRGEQTDGDDVIDRV